VVRAPRQFVSNVNVPDKEENNCMLSAIHETELGKEAKHLTDAALSASQHLHPKEIENITCNYIKLCSEKTLK
jgi:hypothetical protein